MKVLEPCNTKSHGLTVPDPTEGSKEQIVTGVLADLYGLHHAFVLTSTYPQAAML